VYLKTVGEVALRIVADLSLDVVVKRLVQALDVFSKRSPLGSWFLRYNNPSLRQGFG
jgi:hypothetical protein